MGTFGRIRVTSANLQYLFGIQRSEPDCMTRLVSEHDQPHIRSPRKRLHQYPACCGRGSPDPFFKPQGQRRLRLMAQP